LQNLKEAKSSGPVNSPAKFLKELAGELSKPLAHILNSSFDSGKLPSEWKAANIYTISKSRARSNVNNYWPVNLTSSRCKIMESIIKKATMKQLLGDLIQTYRIITGRECALEFADFFELAETEHLRGHPFKLQRKLVHTDIRRNAFSQRVVGEWNGLPEEVSKIFETAGSVFIGLKSSNNVENITKGIESIRLTRKIMGSQSLEFMTLYRPTGMDTNADTCLLENIKEITGRTDFVLMRDFNAPSIRWNDLQVQ
uniref:Endo/exonuclease/phosphatase domain-containing protein n=1 Tax=Schistocephalus solidus TaxID=70667 RepID=A0A183TPX7_SCHSO